MATDPVCGMEVDAHAPAATTEYQGTTFYFCSAHCQSVFDRTPDVHLPAKRRASNADASRTSSRQHQMNGSSGEWVIVVNSGGE